VKGYVDLPYGSDTDGEKCDTAFSFHLFDAGWNRFPIGLGGRWLRTRTPPIRGFATERPAFLYLENFLVD